MRKYIVNVTISLKEQVEKDPRLEAMRQAVIKEYKQKNTKRDIINHLITMVDDKQIEKLFLELFSKAGLPPRYVSIKSLLIQYEQLISRRRWFNAFIKELKAKLKELSPEKFEEVNRNEIDEDKKLAEKLAKAASEYMKDKEAILKPKVQESIRNLVHQDKKLRIKKRQVKIDPENSEVLGNRKISKTMQYLFTEYVQNATIELVTDPEERSEKIKNEILWLQVSIYEIEEGLVYLNQLIESVYMYLNKNNFFKSEPSQWKRQRKEEMDNLVVC